jgi:hypothetical protein
VESLHPTQLPYIPALVLNFPNQLVVISLKWVRVKGQVSDD